MKKIVTNRKLFILLFLLFCLMSFYLYSDLRLSKTAEIGRVTLAVESLTFNRVIEGRSWDVKIARVEKQGEMARATSLDIRVAEQKKVGSLWIRALSADYYENRNDINLFFVDADLALTQRLLNIATPVASYVASKDIWSFGPQVVVKDNTTRVESDHAHLNRSGEIFFEGNVQAQWVER